ncbi:MAG: GntR family transcriptional regulator [Clostridiales bacterium]|nr:GntR family transcriptional regulator [Clostridiales bacterium]
MISVDYRDKRSIYEQLVDRISALAASGVLQPGSQLPSVRQLSAELSINPNTVQRAYAELEREGLIYSVKGRGNFVSQDAVHLQRKRQEALLGEVGRSVDRAMQSGVPGGEIVAYVVQKTGSAEPLEGGSL